MQEWSKHTCKQDTHLHTQTYTHMYTRTHAHMHTHTNTHTHTHTYTHMHTHTLFLQIDELSKGLVLVTGKLNDRLAKVESASDAPSRVRNCKQHVHAINLTHTRAHTCTHTHTHTHTHTQQQQTYTSLPHRPGCVIVKSKQSHTYARAHTYTHMYTHTCRCTHT